MRFAAPALLVLLFVSPASADNHVAKEILKGQLALIDKTRPADPVILRLDQEMEELLQRCEKLPAAQRVDFLAGGLSPQGRVYAVFGMPDLREFAKYLLGLARYPRVNLHREAFAGRDLSAEIRTAYAKCVKARGKPLAKAPLYKVAFGYQHATNAQMQGIDRRLGRHIVVLNRSALAPGRLWDSAIIHETWHCFQESMEGKRSLWDRALHEGVVTHLTQVVDPTLEDHTVMLWSKHEWDSASRHREAIVKSFAEDRNSADPAVVSSYMTLGKPLKKVPGAPSRSGYFVALLAVRAWQEAHPEKGPADLLAAASDEIWLAFDKAAKP